MPGRLTTVEAAAERLGVHHQTVRSWVAKGHLRGYRIRGSRLIRLDADEVDSLLTPVPTAGGGQHG